MRLPSIALAVLALSACGTDSEELVVPGPKVVSTLCEAGCNAGVEEAIVTSKWIQLSDDMFELATELDASPATAGDGTHGRLDPIIDPCGATAYSGSCAEACSGGVAAVPGVGGSCVAIACPTEVVIARCDL